MSITRIAGTNDAVSTPSTRGRRAVGTAAAVYVAAWIAGLLVNSAQLAADASAPETRAYYVDHASAVALQATLVHALAGLALAVLTVGLASGMPAGRSRRAAAVSGTTAAVISVGQAVLACIAVSRASAASADWSRAMRQAINLADSVKLVLLAVLIASVTAAYRRSSRLPRWLTIVGQALVVLLVLGAASFVAPVAALGLPLALSLVLLLVWVGSVGVLAARETLASES
jgi:hypothetical protein